MSEKFEKLTPDLKMRFEEFMSNMGKLATDDLKKRVTDEEALIARLKKLRDETDKKKGL